LAKPDHGALAGLAVLGLPWAKKDAMIAKRVALNIALHTYHGPDGLGELPISRFPVAFLLAMCDAVQEWGRPILQTQDSASVAFDATLRFWDVECKQNRTVFRFTCGPTACGASIVHPRPKGDSSRADSELAKRWQDRCHRVGETWDNDTPGQFAVEVYRDEARHHKRVRDHLICTIPILWR
jgi:hypothetical protein